MGKNITVSGGTTPPAVYLVLNDAAVSKFAEAIQFYTFKKLTLKYPSWRDFCSAQNIPIANVEATLEAYNEAARKGGPDEFGKRSFESAPFRTEEPVTVMLVTPSVHYTMGGLKVWLLCISCFALHMVVSSRLMRTRGLFDQTARLLLACLLREKVKRFVS